MKTNNNETHVLVGISETDTNFSVEKNNHSVWFLKKLQSGNHTMYVPLNKIKNPIILGIFDKEKDKVDFKINKDWVKSLKFQDPKGLINSLNVYQNYSNYTHQFDKDFGLNESYLSMLQSATKESEFKKFVVLKEN